MSLAFEPSLKRLDRDAREAKRAIAVGIAWAEDGRAIADVEFVLKVPRSIIAPTMSVAGLTKFSPMTRS